MKHPAGRVAAICALWTTLAASASAQSSVSYTDSYGPTSTGYYNHSETFTLPGFDGSLGTLNSVTVTYHGQVLNEVLFENTGNAPGSTSGYVFNLDAEHAIGLLALGVDPATLNPFRNYNTLDAAVWGNSANFIASSHMLQEVRELPAPNYYDGTTDYGGTSGFTMPYVALLDVNQSITYTDDSSLAYFLSSNVELYDLQGTGFAMTSYGGNSDFLMITDKAGTVTVTYNFSPASVPEPAGVILGAFGAAFLGLRRRR